MPAFLSFFASRRGIVFAGIFIGLFAALLQEMGNPGNMGICVACFERDIAGALGLHRAAVVQYMRPEIIGFVLGSLLAAYLFKEFRARAGSAPIVRFVLGVFAMIGALVFLGCPWRAMLRLAGGDGNAILGLLGLVGGIWNRRCTRPFMSPAGFDHLEGDQETGSEGNDCSGGYGYLQGERLPGSKQPGMAGKKN